MRFEHPQLLWLLLLALPGLTGFFWWSWRERRRLIAQFVQSRLLANLTVGVSARRLKIRLALLLAAVGLLVITLARPQWGFDWEEAKQRGLDVVVAIDTSRSMLAEDLAPNRLARAKLAALDLKKLARTDRVGLVAFAGSAFLQCPLSFDDEAFRQSVNALDVNIIPQGGTAIAEAIETALAAFKEKSDNHKVLVLFTDGEDHDGQAVETARGAAKDGLCIFTVGVGTPNGELLRITDARGRSDYIKDEQGNVVKSHLNEQLLQQIAQVTTGGFYLRLSGANTIDQLYEKGLAPLPKSEGSAKRIQRWHERYQWVLGLAIVLLLVEMFLPERKLVRRAEAIAAASANVELRKAVSVFILLALPASLWASPSSALKKYEAGKYESSRREYEELLSARPADARLHFNAGTAAFQAQNYDKALKHFSASLDPQNVPLQQRAYYNLGNAQYRLGEDETEPQKKLSHWEEAVQSYESAVKLNPQDADAEYNLELVKKKLEELKQQQQQQQKSQNDQKDKSDQKQDQQSKNDQKQDQQQSGQDKQEKNQQNQQQQEGQQQEQKQQADKPKSPQQDQQPSEANRGSQEKSGQPEEEGGPPQNAVMMRMTPQQARQLLEAMKSEEQTLIFKPQIKTNRQDRLFKDW